MWLTLGFAVLSGGVDVPKPTANALMAQYHVLTDATACKPDPDPTVINVCGRRDRVAEAQRLPLPDEIEYTGPRIPTGEMPSAKMALAQPCGLTGCPGGIDLKKVVATIIHKLSGGD